MYASPPAEIRYYRDMDPWQRHADCGYPVPCLYTCHKTTPTDLRTRQCYSKCWPVICGYLWNATLQATAADPSLQTLLQTVKSGWPDHNADLPAGLLPSWHICDEISTGHGLLFKGQRIIVPSACRKAIRDSLHDSAHLGIDSCVRRARDTVYWPCINVEIKEYIKSSPICADYQRAESPELMLQPVKPSRPWEVVSADIFSYSGKDYLVTVDHFCGFFEIDHLHTMTSQSDINKLRSHFAWYGSPTKFLTGQCPWARIWRVWSIPPILEVQARHLVAVLPQKATEWPKLWSKLRSPFWEKRAIRSLISTLLYSLTEAHPSLILACHLLNSFWCDAQEHHCLPTPHYWHPRSPNHHLRKWSNARNASRRTMIPTLRHYKC